METCIRLCILLVSFSGYVTSQEQCVIGIIADNVFEAFIDGRLVAGGSDFNIQHLVTVPDNSNVLGIHAYNFQGASGIIVMSEPEFSFYTTADENRLLWRCQEVDGPGFRENLHPELIPLDWKLGIDSTWPRAVAVGFWNRTVPWATAINRRNIPIQDARAQWIWTAETGRHDGTDDGYQNVFCSVELPEQCGGRNSSASPNCNSGATSVTIGTVEYCVEYVSPTPASGLTWVQAKAQAMSNNATLLEVTHSLFQDAARTQMLNNQVDNAWIGGRAQYTYPPGPWRFQPACCGLDQLEIEGNPGNQDPYALYKQGCYQESSDTSSNSVSRSDMTVELCVTQMCGQSKYAGLKDGNTCTCSETLSSYGIVVSPTNCAMTCAGGGADCGGSNSHYVYAVGGVKSIDWMGDDQPNNQNGVDYCGALRFATQSGTFQEGKLTDERCRENYLSLCEIPHSAGCPSSIDASLCKAVTHGGIQRRFVMFGLQDSSKMSWYRAQEACSELEGSADLASLFVLQVASEVEVWLRELLQDNAHLFTSGDPKVWLGVSRQSWFWDSGPAVTFTNWATGEPATKDNSQETEEWECMYISEDDNANYLWKAGRCNDVNSDNSYGYIQVTALASEETTYRITTIEIEPTTSEMTTNPTTNRLATTHSNQQTTLLSDFLTTSPFKSTPANMATTDDVTTAATTDLTSNLSTDQPTTVYTDQTYTRMVKPTATEPPAATPSDAPAASESKSKSSSDDGLSTFEIVLIVVLIVVALVLIILIIAFCCYKKKQNANNIGPSKYDARPIAPIPTAGYLGEEESVYTVSENGSTADLLANPAMFGYGNPPPKSARSGERTNRHKIDISD